MFKNGISFLLREVIYESGASGKAGYTMRAHSIRGIAASSASFKNWSIACFLDAGSWRSNSAFTSFYFKDLQFVYEGWEVDWLSPLPDVLQGRRSSYSSVFWLLCSSQFTSRLYSDLLYISWGGT